MAYKNPIPSLDDERVSKNYCICFTFEEDVSLDEATEGINNIIKKNDGIIPTEWVLMGKPSYIRFATKQQ